MVNLITGTDLDDVPLDGTVIDDEIYLLLGNDVSNGGFGNDTIDGGGGSDSINGGAGHDYLLSGYDGLVQVDTLNGGNGDDFIEFQSGAGGTADGGNGIDTLYVAWSGGLGFNEALNIVFTGAGAVISQGTNSIAFSNFEKLWANGGSGADSVSGGSRDDTINVNDGANVVNALGGNDWVGYVTGQLNTLDGGAGDDQLTVFCTNGVGATFTVTGTTATDQHGSVISGFERYAVNGGDAADIITLGSGADNAAGNDGSDTISGGGGNDRLDGMGDNDSISGGAGSDVIIGGLGSDSLRGGSGVDTFVFNDLAEGGDLVEDFAVGTDDFQFSSAALGGLLLPGDPIIVSVGAAVGSDAQFIRSFDAAANVTTLTWDADGTGAGAAVIIAELTGNKALTDADFVII